jgi:hypothetical protein
MPVKDFAFHTSQEANPWVEIDLGRVVSVTGVLAKNRPHGIERAAALRLSVSTDGSKWNEVWHATKPQETWEIPVTDFVAGAQVPGRKARYVRLELKPSAPEFFHPRQVEVWGKE